MSASLTPHTLPSENPHDTSHDAAPCLRAGRRAVGRALVGSLAALAVSPALVEAAGAAEVEKRKPKRKWHRCKVHKKHTCWRARTCRHRKHKPEQPSDPTDPKDPGPPTPPGAYDEPAVVNGLATVLALHLASRFTYGMTPALLAEMGAYPTLQAWLDAQLAPAAINDQAGDALDGWWPRLAWDAPTMWAHEQAMTGEAWSAMADYQRWCLLRRMRSKRQLLESVTEFFENHLHVPVHDDGVFGFCADYGRVIRAHALGRFDQMLVSAITHPAMGISLDNATSTKQAPNENLGRELLELHTVGRGSYDEDDVKTSARILTGYRVKLWTTWQSWYDPASHWTGPVQVMGFSHPNADADGRPVATAYLTYLAHHPATAHRLARKLAVRYVSDNPSAALVDHLAQVYLSHDTAILPMLRALVAHPEFVAARGLKVRNPADDVVATWRALDVQAAPPTGDGSGANAVLWQTVGLGQAPFDSGLPGRTARGRRLVVVGLEDAGLLRDPLHAVRRLVADGPDDLPPTRVVGAAPDRPVHALRRPRGAPPAHPARPDRADPAGRGALAWRPGSRPRPRSRSTTPW